MFRKKVRIGMLIIMLLAAMRGTVMAEEKMSKEEMKEAMQTMVTMMLDVYSGHELAKTMAAYYWQLYNELQKAGFSKEEAIRIIVAQGNVFSSK